MVSEGPAPPYIHTDRSLRSLETKARLGKTISWKGKYRPFLLVGRVAGLDSGPWPVVLGRLHTIVIATVAVGLAVLTTMQIGLEGLEDSSTTNAAIDRGKTLVGSVAAAGCCLMSLSHRSRLAPILSTLDRSATALLDQGFSLRPAFFRSLGLALFLVANTVYEIVVLNTEYKLTEFSYLVEYYSHLVIQAAEYEFVGLVRSLAGMFAALQSEVVSSRVNVHRAHSWIRTNRHLTDLSVRVGDIFGPLLFAGTLANFIIVLNNLYFSLMYFIRRYSTQEATPSTVMYLNLNIYILLRTLEVLSSVHDLRIREIVQSQVETQQDLVLYAGDMLILDFSLLIDMGGAWTTFLVVLLQFQLKPCITSNAIATNSSS